MTRRLLLGALILAAVSGCAEKREPPTLPGAHPAAWLDENSADFHGSVVQSRGTGSCAICHGSDFRGGESGVSCVDCHLQSSRACISCHGGTDNTSGAPPLGLRGEQDDTTLAVGAHSVHLAGAGMTDGVECESCHHLPAFALDSLHLDLGPGGVYAPDSIAEITWHGIADGGGATWDRNARTCAGTYCHGSFTGGDTANVPVWTSAGQAACGSCHDIGSDPATLGWKHEFHVNTGGLRCADCHDNVVDTLLGITGLSLHVNGVADTSTRDRTLCDACHSGGAGACTYCHGGTDNTSGAPPDGLSGETATSQLAVGAHTAHLEDGVVADAFACTVCHVRPDSLSAPGHLGADSVAEITWGGIAPAPGINWNRGTAGCSGSYCHGNFTGGDTANVPVWTSAGQAACGSCHDIGSDPATLGWKHEFHVNTGGLLCADCHDNVVDTLLTVTSLTLHVNGVADTSTRDRTLCDACHSGGAGACTYCHGGTDNASGAPPDGLSGETATSQLAVGAHTAHLEASALADAIECVTCHTVPDSLLAPSHLGVDSIAEVTWGGIAPATGIDWNRGTATCAGTYCHGNFRGGDTTNTAVWTASGQAVCGSCHDVGSDPASLERDHEYHVAGIGLPCAECHLTVVDTLLNIVDSSLHVNGGPDTFIRDWGFCYTCHGDPPAACVACHGGTDNPTGAPPKGLLGQTATTSLAVGAHSAHVENGSLADAFDCIECHLEPTSLLDAGHLGADSVAEITWGGIAPAPGANWNRGSATCSDTYCHGNFGGGEGGNSPVWTGTNQATCGSCHDVGSSPGRLGGEHEKHVREEGLSCNRCHSLTVDLAENITGTSLHVNDQGDVNFSTGQGTFNGNTCSSLGAGCHGSESWY